MFLSLRERLLNSGRSAFASKSSRELIRSAGSPQEVCDVVAGELQANVIVVERNPGVYLVVAGSPWKPTMQALDLIAVELCFQTCEPAGLGSDRAASSDWLFIPVTGHGNVPAVFGIAGRYCRRRFDPSDPSIRLAADALEEIYPAATA